jgi:hypothetical protein
MPALTLLEETVRVVPLAPTPEALVIADYGASEGRNSLLPVATALRARRPRTGAARTISVRRLEPGVLQRCLSINVRHALSKPEKSGRP